ncbi:MAG: GGDEF domain-containing protein [Halieaceae bacterium]|nr:GGDEF domain-containing protein [Halieaceae bacterium]
MIYQRHIPREELFSAQLELLMQHGRVATISANLVGVIAVIALLWPFVSLPYLLLWGAVVLIMLLMRSLSMSNALVERSFNSSPKAVYWQLIIGSAITGLVWSSAYVYSALNLPVAIQYVILLLIVLITAISLAVTVTIREYFLAYLFTALWPIAWWSLVHYQDEAYNLIIGVVLLVVCALLMMVSNWIYRSFRNMIALNWEREAMSRELGDLTNSLRDRNRQLQDARRQLTDLANIDELTGLGNRRLVNKVLQEEINRARRAGSELSLILIDVDYFKNYNDSLGHSAGDTVLQELSDLMQRATSRAGEVVARYGGEEFIIISPNSSPAAARRTASRLQSLVLDERIPHPNSEVSDYITISQGVVTVTPDGELQPGELINRADEALYAAKGAGRNTISVG